MVLNADKDEMRKYGKAGSIGHLLLLFEFKGPPSINICLGCQDFFGIIFKGNQLIVKLLPLAFRP